ncbi:hypothetical protein Pst134EA_019230 [Puccinia striiformis f. sp. tritici]|uniref:hypothetical protein n=1 Tax=Puccinia striiformis f. sp. tritici TaxID=168172 RepID=UPI00200821A9|nr:hypothetical protein Pst134EA_019230 [Puccinia striiformis f. sp. tritici]KAH9459079.1 hypothetical protein Pst134EA_019230 [Puccinia striiformis f. sp. tritici]
MTRGSSLSSSFPNSSAIWLVTRLPRVILLPFNFLGGFIASNGEGIIAQLISNMASDPTASGDPLAINFLGGIASNGKGIIAQLVLPQLISNMASDPTASGDPLAINFLGGFIASNGEGIIAELSITVWYFQPGLHY